MAMRMSAMFFGRGNPMSALATTRGRKVGRSWDKIFHGPARCYADRPPVPIRHLGERHAATAHDPQRRRLFAEPAGPTIRRASNAADWLPRDAFRGTWLPA